MRRCLAGLATIALTVACQRDALPPRVTVEDVVDDIAPPLAAGAILDEPRPGAVRPAVLQPGDPLAGAGPRPAVAAPPPSVIRVALDVPDGAALRFSAAVDGDKRRRDDRSGVTFRVTVDGVERFAETVNPAARGRHRRWLEGHIDLRREAGRRVEVAFETRAEDPALPIAGTPGWSHVRLVRETTRDRQAARAGAPNLLVVLVDTLRSDRVGAYGARPSPSPTLDRLAARGVVFQESVAQSSWTLPSVGSLLTGLHPRSHGAIGDREGREPAGDAPRGAAFLGDGVVTVAELAQRAGITTVGVSSNPLVSRATNFAQGFEHFIELPWDWRGHDWPRAPDVNRAFLDWLARHHGWRFVAYLHYMEPHDPYTPPPALRPSPPTDVRPAVAAGKIDELAKAINFRGAPPLSAAEVAWLRRLYDAEVGAWDDALAALLDGLASAGVLDSTIIVVTADHGEEFQEHGRLKHGSHLYDESIRVPLIVVGPGIAPARRPDLAQGIDLLPTVAGRLELERPSGLPGRDLLATTTGPDAILETGSGIAPNGSPVDVLALRTPHWKLIRTPALGRTELYDLAHDAGERASQPANGQSAALGAALDRWAAAAPSPPRADGSDPALRAKLRALGYVE